MSGPQWPSLSSRLPRDVNTMSGAAALIVFCVLPTITGFGGTASNVVLYMGVYMILSLGLNVVVGFTGLLDLGYVTFLATGAVVAGFLLSLTMTADGTIVSPVGMSARVEGASVLGSTGGVLLILAAAGGVCAVVGVLRGIPTLRLRGDYYAIVTLGMAEIFFETALWDESNLVNVQRFTGGTFAITLPDSHVPTFLGEKLYWDGPRFYYLVIALVALTMLVTHHLNRSRVGRALAAIRLDETAARSCGVDVSKHKLVAFAVSGFIGGIGGAMYALRNGGFVSVKDLDVWQSILILCGVVLGGMGSIRGTAFGIAALMGLGELLREDIGGVTVPPEARYLIYGLLLIAVMRFRPQGLFPPVRRGQVLTEGEQAELRETPTELYALGIREEAR